jgi:hypothetical protein
MTRNGGMRTEKNIEECYAGATDKRPELPMD